MNRFTKSRTIPLSRIWQFISLLFVIGFLIFFISGINTVDDTTSSEQAKSLETAVRRSVAQCYAVEGTYPPSLEYLEENYGLIYDTDSFYIDYTAIGSNIMPDITILPRTNESGGDD